MRRPTLVKVRAHSADKQPGIEPQQVVWSIDWLKAWDEFVSRSEDGSSKYCGSRQLADHLAVGKDEAARRRSAEIIYSAIGPQSAYKRFHRSS